MKLQLFIDGLNSGRYDGTFEKLYGKENIRGTVDRYLRICQNFERRFPQHEEIAAVSTPGRTEISGNHTDHNGGYVLAASINLDMISIAAKNDSNVVRMVSEGYDEIELSLDSLNIADSERLTTSALIRGVAAKMSEQGYSIGGFDCVTHSNVPGGAGLSSSAAFEVQTGSIFNYLFNDGKMDAVTNAKIAQYAENNYFGKPCGLMDQTACSVGGMLKIDFADATAPIIESIDFDFAAQKHSLYIVNTGGSHADLNEDYKAMPDEMKLIAQQFGQPLLRGVRQSDVMSNISELRKLGNDRAILRAFHYFNDNRRVLQQAEALKANDFGTFKKLVIESGQSSFMYLQNVYTTALWQEQGVSLALMLAQNCLADCGAWRVHGGGFAGTIAAFVPENRAAEFETTMDAVFGKGASIRTMIRPQGSLLLEK